MDHVLLAIYRLQRARRLLTSWQLGNYPETGFEEISGDVREADSWTGIGSGWPVAVGFKESPCIQTARSAPAELIAFAVGGFPQIMAVNRSTIGR
jgi:hypothetical protein